MQPEKMLDKYLCSDYEQPGTLFEIFNNKNYSDKICDFIVPFGKEENGDIVYQDLSQISHMLISGTTGSGKTTFIQSIMTSLMLSTPEDKIKFIIFDSKQIDYMFFQGIPQLLIPILTDFQKIAGVLTWAISEARNRLHQIAEQSAKTNELPHLFIILDDYSAIMSDECKNHLVELLKIGRQTNIHCILSTSTPTSNNVSTEIKMNIPCRIAFHTTQKSVSRMIIDENGAELLQIPGEMIFKGQNQKMKCTGFYVTDEEIKKITRESDAAKKASLQDFGEQVKAIFGNTPTFNQQEFDEDEDLLLPQAIELACELGQISTAMIQRKLKIGYSRANRIIEQMEKRGLISEANGSKPREIMIDKDNHNPRTTTFDECQKSKEKLAEQSDEEKTAVLHPFTKIESCGESIEVKDNLVYVKKITKRQSPYVHTAEYTFDNRRLCEIVYTKPKLFSKGSFTFILKPNSWNVTDQRIDKTYESDLPKTELSLVVTKNNAVLFENLAKQLAKECSIEVHYE